MRLQYINYKEGRWIVLLPVIGIMVQTGSMYCFQDFEQARDYMCVILFYIQSVNQCHKNAKYSWRNAPENFQHIQTQDHILYLVNTTINITQLTNKNKF